MKKIILFTMLLLASSAVFSQSTTINYANWSDPNTFKGSPSPLIKGYGYYSDSLSKVFDSKIFYEYNNEYYCIESWADYYYWFIKKYRHMFEEPQLYEYYYLCNNNFGMASYIASSKYLGKYYPSSIQVKFDNLLVEDNRLNTDKYFTEISDKKFEDLNKQLNAPKDLKKTTKPQIMVKPKAIELYYEDQFIKKPHEKGKERIDATDKGDSDTHNNPSKKNTLVK